MHPHLFQFGRIILPTYGFLVALGAILALLLCVRSARLLGLDSEKVWSVALLAVVITLVARILLNFLRWPRYASGIGLAAAAIAAMSYAASLGLPLRRTADAFAPSLALVSAVVSIACLEAGCDYGTPTNVPWAVVFRSSALPGPPLGVPLHPTQLYAGTIEFLLFAFLLWLLYRPHGDGEILGAWLFLGGLSGSLLTLLRGGDILATQLVSAVMVLGGGLLWLRRPQVCHGG